MISVSIVIPCYNEENNLKRGVLEEIDRYLKTQEYLYEVLICNDQSTDDSLNLAEKFSKGLSHFQVFDFPKGGKPGAIWHGIQKAKYPIILFTDMDQSTPLKELSKLLPYYQSKNSFDIVIF